MTVSETEETTPDTPEPEETTEGEDETEADEVEPDERPAEDAVEIVPHAQTEKEVEARMKKLDAEAERHAKRVNEILGEDALELIQCEACPPNTPGWHYPANFFPADHPSHALYSMLAGGSGAEHKHPDYFETCQECNGWGNVLTGAQMGLITYEIACPVCKTQGYIDKRQAQAAPVVALTPVNGASGPPEVDPSALEDMWGRPYGHPRHGKFPIYLTPAERAEDLAAGFSVGA